jgi:WD40 repeat protein
MQVMSGHLGWVRSIAFDPGNEWFCTGSAYRTIKVKHTLSFLFCSLWYFLFLSSKLIQYFNEILNKLCAT